MNRLTIENLNRFIESVSGSDTNCIELPITGTYPQKQMIDIGKLSSAREEFKDLFRQNLLCFSKRKKDLPLEYCYCTGERNENGSFPRWTDNPDDVKRFVFIARALKLLTDISQKTVEKNGQKVTGTFVSLSEEEIKPAVVRETPKPAENRTIKKLSVKSLNRFIDSVSQQGPEGAYELPESSSYNKRYIDLTELIHKREEFKDLFRQNLIAFAKKKTDLPISLVYRTGEKDASGQYKLWTSNTDDVYRFIRLGVLTKLITESGNKTIVLDGKETEMFCVTVTDKEEIQPIKVKAEEKEPEVQIPPLPPERIEKLREEFASYALPEEYFKLLCDKIAAEEKLDQLVTADQLFGVIRACADILYGEGLLKFYQDEIRDLISPDRQNIDTQQAIRKLNAYVRNYGPPAALQEYNTLTDANAFKYASHTMIEEKKFSWYSEQQLKEMRLIADIMVKILSEEKPMVSLDTVEKKIVKECQNVMYHMLAIQYVKEREAAGQ